MLSEKADGKMAKAGHILQSPSEYCIAQGLAGLHVVIEETGQSRQTLQNWHRNKPDLFKVVVRGSYENKNSKKKER